MFQTLPTFWVERIEILEFWMLAISGPRVLRALSTFFPLAILGHLEKSSLNYPVYYRGGVIFRKFKFRYGTFSEFCPAEL